MFLNSVGFVVIFILLRQDVVEGYRVVDCGQEKGLDALVLNEVGAGWRSCA